jgi:hypothetical protein
MMARATLMPAVILMGLMRFFFMLPHRVVHMI